MTTQIQKTQDVKTLMYREDVQKKFAEILGGQKSKGFIVSVLNAVQNNDKLKGATPESILFAAANAATMDLPVNQNLGFAYIVPYTQKTADGKYVTVAQFQIGYKGLIQLCQRSGLFKTISASAIYLGQIKTNNPLTGIEFDFNIQPEGKPVGYAAYFELLNGFNKTLYMTVQEVEAHGARYSKTYSNNYSVWKTDFDAMAQKTVLKLLLSKYAPMTIDMQRAVITDQSVVNDYEGENVTYVDNDGVVLSDEQTGLLSEIDNLDQNEATKSMLRKKVNEGKTDEVKKFLNKQAEAGKETTNE